jgi:hypothetical protein
VSAGITKANTLVRDAMLNPELARELLKATPNARISGRDWTTLRNALAKNAVFNATVARSSSSNMAQGPSGNSGDIFDLDSGQTQPEGAKPGDVIDLDNGDRTTPNRQYAKGGAGQVQSRPARRAPDVLCR